MNKEIPEFKFYIVQGADGRFLSNRCGDLFCNNDIWEDSILNARIFTSADEARRAIATIAIKQFNSEWTLPDIILFIARPTKILDKNSKTENENEDAVLRAIEKLLKITSGSPED